MRYPLLLSALLLALPLSVAAQTTGTQTSGTQTTGTRTTEELLLPGTTLGLPWGLYSRPPTSLASVVQGEARLWLSPPGGASVLGTRYDPANQAALLVYRSPLGAERALGFAVGQLRDQGFNVTASSTSTPGEARALLRRTSRLLEVRVTRGTGGTVRTQYLFRDGERPERLLVNNLPESVIVYAAPVNLTTVVTVPGRVILTAPADVLIQRASQSGNATTLTFSGTFTLTELERFYRDLFVGQGFIQTEAVSTEADQRVLRFSRANAGRAAESLSLTLTLPVQGQARVTLRADLRPS